jgi:putative sporulation protein YyaC
MSGKRMNYEDENISQEMGEFLVQQIREESPKGILIACIGTDKCIGDSIGPLVGTLLTESHFSLPVVGTLDKPIHAINIESMLQDIKDKYTGYYIIAVDACLGHDNCVGDIQIKEGSVRPGAGVGKKLPSIGDIAIVGVVDDIENNDLFSIKNIRLSFIWKMAHAIVDTLRCFERELYKLEVANTRED